VGGVVVDNQLQVMAGIAQGTAQPLHLESWGQEPAQVSISAVPFSPSSD
jgi:hypothetical protein